jgi:hypothetical protein
MACFPRNLSIRKEILVKIKKKIQLKYTSQLSNVSIIFWKTCEKYFINVHLKKWLWLLFKVFFTWKCFKIIFFYFLKIICDISASK